MDYTPAMKKLLNKLEEEMNENEFVALSVDEVRGFFEGRDLEALENALDHAQGEVHSGKVKVAYILIKVE